jgi:hypothetical protein
LIGHIDRHCLWTRPNFPEGRRATAQTVNDREGIGQLSMRRSTKKPVFSACDCTGMSDFEANREFPKRAEIDF